ncbi:DUF1674 domain-containing protein [Fulvimonas soli]|jgi:hypothetical protein|uniref:Uncharacterized protein DUF1674 n=1 Tax=Fulvimonas soli TaxID=155197 RepID=A0A316IJH0_9GAMM|nr:DUF1674 domain-containing protein [Fulvimonas soli]PWK92936.1 uncharacterized protein DUF1674 [Fulvimonas soli]TNY26582.1 DUF1674 domain-containing protein [Fulvimonas soli]
MSDTSSQTGSEPVAADIAERPAAPAIPAGGKERTERTAPDPTRYGDWEKNGRCIDF